MEDRRLWDRHRHRTFRQRAATSHAPCACDRGASGARAGRRATRPRRAPYSGRRSPSIAHAPPRSRAALQARNIRRRELCIAESVRKPLTPTFRNDTCESRTALTPARQHCPARWSLSTQATIKSLLFHRNRAIPRPLGRLAHNRHIGVRGLVSPPLAPLSVRPGDSRCPGRWKRRRERGRHACSGARSLWPRCCPRSRSRPSAPRVRHS